MCVLKLCNEGILRPLYIYFTLYRGAAIGYTYEDPEVQQRKDEEILAAFLGEGEVQEEEESSDSEFGE